MIIDNFDNAFPECYNRMQKLAGSKAENMSLIKARMRWRLGWLKPPTCCRVASDQLAVRNRHAVWRQGDLRHPEDLEKLFSAHKCVNDLCQP